MKAYRSAAAVAIATAIACSFAATASADSAPTAASSVPLDAPRFIRAGDFATDVTLRWTERPSRHPGGEDDPGPSVADGSVAIVSGSARADTVVSFATLRIAPPNIAQMIPLDASSACGASGPIAIVPLAQSAAPAVLVTSVAIGKGCFPIPHVLVPVDDRSRRYRSLGVYGFTRTPGTAAPTTSPRVTIRVVRARAIAVPDPPKTSRAIDPRNREIVVIDGLDAANHATTVAVESGFFGSAFFQGKVLALEGAPNGFAGVAFVVPSLASHGAP